MTGPQDHRDDLVTGDNTEGQGLFSRHVCFSVVWPPVYGERDLGGGGWLRK